MLFLQEWNLSHLSLVNILLMPVVSQPRSQGLSSYIGGGKMRDPGNEVGGKFTIITIFG